MDCKTCKEARNFVPANIHEADLDREDRANKRLFVAWIVTLVFLAGCVVYIGWLKDQYRKVTTEYEYTVSQDVETGEGDAFVSGVGNIYYGES